MTVSVKRKWIIADHKKTALDSLRPRQNGCHFADDVFKFIILGDKISVWTNISLAFISKISSDDKPALAQVMPRRCASDEPLSESLVD